MIDVFSRETLSDIHLSELCIRIDKQKYRHNKVQSKDEATTLLSQLCINLDEHASSVIRGIIKAMTEMPLQAIKDKTSIGKYKFTTTYFHPILSSILSNPDKQTLLRWTNIETDSSKSVIHPGHYIILLKDLDLNLLDYEPSCKANKSIAKDHESIYGNNIPLSRGFRRRNNLFFVNKTY
ncbi:uncharacterized protein BX663DRAFT_551445 [Cokeromyces recurvatus]|uniref:uncharacterized protein n=1 Tax=Cokeromyces recurvatus TaxID=90255 RepID=UPI002220466B|nr:uncharacterized protein BX663DRAFT_551445 [Cokeromyces recurvatus]KAI7903130.1 hypothetical protein BX663DRAFT_551445 [Cokeromyces recurvatus]